MGSLVWTSAVGGGLVTTDERLERLESNIILLRHQMGLLFTALENVRVLSAVRDEAGTVVGLNAQVAPPMVQAGTAT